MRKFKNIYIEITNMCNLSCSFCPKTSRKKRAMTAMEFSHVLDKIILHTEYIYLHVVGEPLLNPEFDKILSYCDEKNAKIKLTTNGTQLMAKLESIRVHSCIKAVNISLSCIKDFDSVMTQKYLDEAFFAAKYLSQNEVTTVLRAWTDIKNISLIKEKIKADFNADISLTDNGFQKISNHLLFSLESEFVWPVRSTAVANLQNNCLGLRKQIAFLSDGTVVPCCLDNDGKLNLGNIFESTLEEILSCERAVKIAQGFRNSKAVETFCKTCTFSKGKAE